MKKAARRGRNLAAKILSPEGDACILIIPWFHASIFPEKIFPIHSRRGDHANTPPVAGHAVKFFDRSA
jgi:hypothetical protein